MTMVTKTIPKGGLKRSPISAVTLLQESPRGSNLQPIIAGSQPRSSYRESKIERERERESGEEIKERVHKSAEPK